MSKRLPPGAPFLLHHMVEASALRLPDRPAFRFLDQELSHAALDRRSDQLAAVLAEHGVRKGDRVGLYLNKSLEAAIAIYGIMKAGAAYVPIDPGAPLARVRTIMADCGIAVLVTHPPKQADVAALLDGGAALVAIIGLAQDALGRTATRAVAWDEVWQADPAARPQITMMREDLAYIIFTSGSTGTPKGIMHSHRSGLAYARMAAAVYGVSAEDRLSNHSPLHFDMSTFDYFCAPLSGACTVIIPEAYAKLPASLAELIERERLSIWYSVPFALIQLLTHGLIERRDCSALRWVLYGGEPFAPKHLAALMRIWPQARFSNVYGPAEVNQCTYHHVPATVADAPSEVPIGAVWPDAEGLVLDDDDSLCAPGALGELVVRTPTMMRGYWRREDLNARAFYVRRQAGGAPDVFYRTGDLVRADDAGTLVLLGRKDRQVKVRGFRVELDEIEAVLARHEAVIEVAVVAIGDAVHGRAIHAAVRTRPHVAVTAADLLAFASAYLPAYAVPVDVHLTEAFPRTTSGKIDRPALARATEAALADQGA